jgi:signal peptidase I
MSEEMSELKWSTPRVRQKVLYRTMLAAFLCYAFFQWVLWPVKVVGDSMLPTYHDGARHFINKLAYVIDAPQRGDVIGFRAPDGDVLIKRIIGLPGERIDFLGGRVFINGAILKEPYTETIIPGHWEVTGMRLGPKMYYVMGDNRKTSVLGHIQSERIIGKVMF